MSECLLNDLVPQAKFNKVTLESIDTAGDDYRVTCDVSIFDSVSSEGEILTHFFSQDFKEYFTLNTIIARDALALEAIEIIQGLGMEEYQTSRLIILLFARAYPPYQDFMNIDYVPSLSAISRLEELFSSMTSESYDFDIHNFASPLGQEQTGINKFDDMGNLTYDLRIPYDSQPRFRNSIEISDCKLFLIPHYNFLQAMQDSGVSPPTGIQYYNQLDVYAYGSTYSIDVLTEKQIVDSRVQDFRLIDRTVDFVSRDTEIGHEREVEMIQRITGRSMYNSNITTNAISPLMSTFGKRGDRIVTKNFFIFDIGTVLYRNSNRKFMYANYNEDLGSNLINSIRLRKDRVDAKRDPVFITSLIEKQIDENSMLSFCFEDQEQLNVGEYSYTLEMSIVDPLQEIAEGYVFDVRSNLLPKLQEAKEYLNNTREYDAIRQEITNTGKQRLNTILDNTATKQSFISFIDLFKLLTGEVFALVCPSIGRIRKLWTNPHPFRLVDSLIKVVEDILFETSKYFEISAIINSTTRVSPSSMIDIEYTFKQLVDYGIKSKGLYDIVEGRVGTPFSTIDMKKVQFRNRMNDEGKKFDPNGYADSQNLGYMTPNKFRDFDLRDGQESKDAFFSILSTSIVGNENTNITIDKALQDPDNSSVSSYSLKKDHATFESFAGTLGLSIENRTVISERKSDSTGRQKVGTTLGIDYGTNSSDERNRNFLDIGKKDEDKKQSRADRKSTILEKRSKEEELISRFLSSTDGYDMFRRESLTQGDVLVSRFSPAYILPRLQTGQDIPVFLQDNGRELIIREPESVFDSLYNKLFVNNVYVVQYLFSTKDENGNLVLQWETISNFDNVPDNVLCRLERYRNDGLYITDSHVVDREIMSKYFYLTN